VPRRRRRTLPLYGGAFLVRMARSSCGAARLARAANKHPHPRQTTGAVWWPSYKRGCSRRPVCASPASCPISAAGSSVEELCVRCLLFSAFSAPAFYYSRSLPFHAAYPHKRLCHCPIFCRCRRCARLAWAEFSTRRTSPTSGMRRFGAERFAFRRDSGISRAATRYLRICGRLARIHQHALLR